MLFYLILKAAWWAMACLFLVIRFEDKKITNWAIRKLELAMDEMFYHYQETRFFVHT